MVESVRRTLAWMIGAVAAGVVGAIAARVAVAPTGAPAPGVLFAEGPLLTAVVILIALAVMAGIGGVVARWSNSAVGLFVVGCGIFVLARRMGDVKVLAFAESSLVPAAIESLLWAIALLGAVMIVFRIGGPLRDVEPDEYGRRPHPLLSREAAVMASVAVLVPVLVWVIAQTPMKGQVLAATILGSMVAGLAGRLLSPHVQPMLLFVAPCVFGAIGHFAGAVMLAGSPASGVVTGAITPLSLPMPVDYAAGALLGVSMGLGWAKSFLHHEETQTSAVPAA